MLPFARQGFGRPSAWSIIVLWSVTKRRREEKYWSSPAFKVSQQVSLFLIDGLVT